MPGLAHIGDLLRCNCSSLQQHVVKRQLFVLWQPFVQCSAHFQQLFEPVQPRKRGGRGRTGCADWLSGPVSPISPHGSGPLQMKSISNENQFSPNIPDFHQPKAHNSGKHNSYRGTYVNESPPWFGQLQNTNHGKFEYSAEVFHSCSTRSSRMLPGLRLFFWAS